MSGLGYRELGAYLRGEMSLADATQRLKFATHAFIRKQLIWFRSDVRIHWLDAADAGVVDHAATVISGWRATA
jgi:tRNA dimethylallyltransferase